MDNKIILLALIIGVSLLASCAKTGNTQENPQIANPASVYCNEQGGSIKIIEEEAGQRGICVLKDGTECDEWAYFRKECPENPSGNSSALAKTLTYQLMQCQDTPWNLWYKKGTIKFVKAPTEKELAIAFFGNEYQIEILGFEKEEHDIITCQACDTCPTSYSYKITIKEGDYEKVKALFEGK